MYYLTVILFKKQIPIYKQFILPIYLHKTLVNVELYFFGSMMPLCKICNNKYFNLQGIISIRKSLYFYF